MHWLPVVALVVGLLVLLLRAVSAGRRRRHLAAGEAVTCRARLGAATGRLHRGRLTLSAQDVVWSGRGGHVPLSGARVLSVDGRAGWGSQAGDELVRLRRPDGSDVRLALFGADADLLCERLLDGGGVVGAGPPSGPAPAFPRPSRRRWPLVLLALAAVWLCGWAYLVVGGRTVTAEVVAPLEDGSCDVTWTSASGAPQATEVDCAGEPAGTAKQVWELAPPFADDAVDPAWTAGGTLVVALLVALPAVGGLVADRRDRRDRWPPTGGPPSAGGDERPPGDQLPDLAPDDVLPTFDAPPVVLARYAPYAHRQRPSDGWEHPRRPAGAGVPSLLRDLPRSLLWPVVGLGVVVLLTAPAPWRWWVLATTDTAHATATSTGEVVVDGPVLVPDEVTVTYRDLAGAARRADVATTRDLPRGEQVGVTYSTTDPGWARVDGGGDGLPRYLLLFVAGSVVALGVAGASTWRLLTARGRLRGAAATPDRPALATLTSTPDGWPVLLVCDPVSQPARLLAVPVQAPLPHGAAAAFPADRALGVRTHGRLGEDEAVVVDVPGVSAPLLPAGGAWVPDAEDLLVLLDVGHALRGLPDDEDDWDEDEEHSRSAARD